MDDELWIDPKEDARLDLALRRFLALGPPRTWEDVREHIAATEDVAEQLDRIGSKH